MIAKPTIPTRPGTHRCGTIYITVLAVSMFVAVIGLSALLITRIQNRSVGGNLDTIKARYGAQSGLEMGLYSISKNSAWRSTSQNDVWSSGVSWNDATLALKLVDEGDGDLANDPADPVRLYGKATVGEAVRIFSALLEAQTPVNLLANADMENGTADWHVPDAAADLESRTDNPHGGVAYIYVKNRTNADAGLRQDITSRITNGATYDTEVWVKTKDFPDGVQVIMQVETSNGSQEFTFLGIGVSTTWTKVSGTATPVWTGTLHKIFWKIRTLVTSQEFKIDDTILIEGGGPPTIRMRPVPSSWRQDVLP